jgi:phenylalanyl-tRNA synthetase beta chain
MSFASRDDLALMGDGEAIRVTNPLAADQAFLRTSLVPGVLRAVRTNRARHGIGSALFEVGRVFRPGKPVEEAERIAIALSGSDSTGYPGEARDLDFLDAKGVVEALFGSIGAPAWTLGGPAGPPFHPGRSALVLVRGQEAGVMGELHPRIAESLDLPGRVALAELDGSALAGARKGQVAYREVPRFPPVHRDLAFVVDEGVPAGALREALVHAGGGLVDTATLFDVFAGPPIPEGKKSLAFAVAFRVVDRTLTDQEADEAVGRIVERLSRSFSAELRSG